MKNASLPMRLGALWIALLAVGTPLAASAETGEVAALRQEVTELKQVVERLDGRVERLERQLSSSPSKSSFEGSQSPAAPVPPSPAPAAPAESVRDHWRRIDHGMTTQEVEALLGPPQRTMTVNTRTVWYYTYPEVGSGSVVFAPDDGVADWQVPPFNTWW